MPSKTIVRKRTPFTRAQQLMHRSQNYSIADGVFVCPICSRRYSLKAGSMLSRHVERKHGMDVGSLLPLKVHERADSIFKMMLRVENLLLSRVPLEIHWPKDDVKITREVAPIVRDMRRHGRKMQADLFAAIKHIFQLWPWPDQKVV